MIIIQEISGSLWQYYKDEPALTDDDGAIDFPDANSNSSLFNFKQKVTGQTGDLLKKWYH